MAESNLPSDKSVNQYRRDYTPEFTTYEVFSTREAMLNWVHEIGRKNGFVIVIGRSANSTATRLPKCILIYVKGGKYKKPTHLVEGKNSQRKTASNKNGCPFVLRVIAYNTTAGIIWGVKVTNGLHNHEPAECFEGHEYPSRLKPTENDFVIDMANSTAPRFILGVLKKRDNSNTTGIRSIYNVIARHKEDKRGGQSSTQYALSLLTSKRYHHDFRTNPTTDEITDIIWAHPQSLALYVIFPTMLVIDATYKTNQYRLPLLEVVGITSTLKTFSIMFAYLSNERAEQVTWALNTLKNWMSGRGAVMPSVIVSDHDLVLLKAIDICFSKAQHMLSIWHINQNIVKRCSPMLGAVFKSFLRSWQKLYTSLTETSYEQRWNTLCAEYGSDSPVIEYVRNTWLLPYKERFVVAWTNTYMHLGSTSNQRVESTHAMLKRHLGGDTMSCLETSISKIDDILSMQFGTIKESFQNSINKPRHVHVEEPLYDSLRCHVSLEALDLIDWQLQYINHVSPNRGDHCSCVIKMTHGLPCVHDLAYYRSHSIPIPLSVINSHWKKLSVHDDEYASVYMIDLNKSPLDFEEMIPNQQDHSTLKAPVYNTTHKGRPIGRVEQNPRRMRSSLEVSRRRSKVEQNIEMRDDLCRPYIDSLPEPLRDYITHAVNVTGDGNCGFSAIAAQIGYGEEGWLQVRMELIQELQQNRDLYDGLHMVTGYIDYLLRSLSYSDSSAPQDFWIDAMNLGVVIASRYNIVLHTFGPLVQHCFTHLPLRSPPVPNHEQREIDIACVDNHFVQVFLRRYYPVPPMSDWWWNNVNDETIEWAELYRVQRDLWEFIMN